MNMEAKEDSPKRNLSPTESMHQIATLRLIFSWAVKSFDIVVCGRLRATAL